MDAKHNLFKRNQVVIDLGYAPGSWSQVAVERTKPNGVIVGIDLIPAQPPRGMTSIQGDFLSPQVRKLTREVMLEQVRRRRREAAAERKMVAAEQQQQQQEESEQQGPQDLVQDRPSYIDMEKAASHEIEEVEANADQVGRMVDVSFFSKAPGFICLTCTVKMRTEKLTKHW